MKHVVQYFLVECLVVCLILSGFQQAFAASPCSVGIGEPPFLSFGVRSNLLLLIDNSGSMLDPAYIDETRQCVDETYDNTETYSGYFNSASWYSYDFSTDEQFELEGAMPAVCATADYYAQDGTGTKYVCLDLDLAPTPDTVTAFVATGNFMNWVASSKFDIQKEILTGGKYDSVNQQLHMESRGCMNRRFVKQVNFAQTDARGDNYKLSLSVRGPMEVFETWLVRTGYVVGDIVLSGGILYKANSTHTSSNVDFATDIAKWDEYKDTRWYASHAYPANSVVLDTESQEWYWTQSGGTSLAGAADISEDTSVTWVRYDGTSIDIFNPVADGFDVTACELALAELGSLTGVDDNDEKSRLGRLKSYTEDCMGFAPGGGNTVEKARKSSFNHAMQECWYYNEFGNWQPGGGTVSSMQNSCENVYDYMEPGDITPWDSAYVCNGSYTPDNDKSGNGYVGRCWEVSTGGGGCVDEVCPAGRNDGDWWDVGSERYWCDGGILKVCTKNNCKVPGDRNFDPTDWAVEQVCAGGGGDLNQEWTNDDFYYFDPCTYRTCTENDPLMLTCSAQTSCTVDSDTWTCADTVGGDGVMDECYIADQSSNGDRCVDQAIKDFCGIISVAEVIDPSDSTGLTGEVWNAPAFLIDGGIMGQLDMPLATMNGRVEQTTVPEGVLHSTAQDLRIGAMAFNAVGAKAECDAVDTSDVVEEYCPAENRDGGEVIAEIKLGSLNTGSQTHVEDIADAINDVRATSWTPLAETMYNAIGYYTQNTSLRLYSEDANNNGVLDAGEDANGNGVLDDDFSTITDPITNWCQENHVLIITEGASTADVNQDVIDYVNAFPINDDLLDEAADDQKCTDGLQGSSYLDDLTYIAHNAAANQLYPAGNSQLPSDDGTLKDKKNITTHIVVSGTLRDNGSDECSPDELMEDAATNGGSTLMVSANPVELENNLLATLNDLRQRASAGSAASVISSARGGEGAIYQAIFWPELKRQDNGANDQTVSWVGDLHALFVDDNGYMYEDTDGNRIMEPTEDKDNDGLLGLVDEDDDGDGHLDVDEDANLDGILQVGEDLDGDGHLDIHEDLDNDGCLDVDEDIDGDGILDGADKRVIIYFDSNDNRSKGCYNTSFYDSGTCSSSVELADVNFLWSANDWLARISNLTLSNLAFVAYDADDIFMNREDADYISNVSRRYIFTWNDLNNDGVVDEATEVLPFVDRDVSGNAVDWSAYGVTGRGTVEKDFDAADNNEVRQIVRWVRGADWTTEDIDGDGVLDAGEDLDGDGHLDVFEDSNGNGVLDAGEDLDGDGSLESPVRRRQIPVTDGSATSMTWRLGDIIHSTPMTVAAPAEEYHLIYNDSSYARFLSTYKRRRHVVYFGANDGMLHAVNGGFYSEKEKKFCLSPLNADGTCTDGGNAPALGTELWGYVPYNLLPHLKCLTNTGYSGSSHKYYVDLRPRIFDAKIFTPDAVHTEGWGTILVGGMRFGGAPVDAAADLGQPNTDNRGFISSYFILDITNPEQPPTLLGELTQTLSDSDADTIPDTPDFVDLGYSTVISTMVIMKDKNSVPEDNDWYLILGSGPHGSDAVKGVSDQIPKLSVVYLNDLVDVNNKGAKALRIPAALPVSGSPEDGTYDLSARSVNGFVSDPVTIDFDINPSAENYKADAVYFGTVEGDFDAGMTFWDGGGILYRLVTREIDVFGESEYGDGVSDTVTVPSDWQIKPLIDTGKPITAPATAGTDGRNFWIYFGTGRFFDAIDKTDATQQRYFGIKEPMEFTDPIPANCLSSTRKFTWDEVEVAGTALSTDDPGVKGLLQVDDIEVISPSTLSCRSDPILNSCLPAGMSPLFNNLVDYIAGSGSCSGVNYTGSVDGWYKDFYPYANRERNLGQATLLGGLLTFTTYQPYQDACMAEGLAYLYGLYYQTGTAWYENIFGDETHPVLDKISLGRGLALTPNLHIGSGEGDGGDGPKIFVQTSTGEIKEIEQQNSPYSVRPGKFKWHEFNGCP